MTRSDSSRTGSQGLMASDCSPRFWPSDDRRTAGKAALFGPGSGCPRRLQTRSDKSQRGFSLIGFLCTLLVVAAAGLLALRAGPSLLEFWAVKNAIKTASAMANTPEELRKTFDKLASAGFIDAITGKELEVSGRGKDMQVSFAYQKRIALIGPTSLLIEYQGSTAQDVPEKAAN